jgi:spermidine synthase
MTPPQSSRLRRAALVAVVMGLPVLGLGLAFVLLNQNGEGGESYGGGAVVHEERSEFSRIKIRQSKNERALWFVRDNGDEVIESIVDIAKPHNLLVTYTKFMFTSYLVRPKQEKVLIVGLGGGSMVHFLRKYDPDCKVDVVEIDPVIVKVADKYFGVKSGGNVNIITQDAFAFFKNTENRYDVIYMDAFLKPSDKTDSTGVPLRLKTIMFYKDLQKKLTPDGMVVFNINPHDDLSDDLKNIKEAFAQSYFFELPNYGGIVAIGSTAAKRVSVEAQLAEATAIDRRWNASYSFRDMVRRQK